MTDRFNIHPDITRSSTLPGSFYKSQDIYDELGFPASTDHLPELVVDAVQRGVKSRLYTAGHFSAQQERGVHHFHALLAAVLQVDPVVA